MQKRWESGKKNFKELMRELASHAEKRQNGRIGSCEMKWKDYEWKMRTFSRSKSNLHQGSTT